MRKDQFLLAVLVANRFGVLSRVAGLFSRRGYNIDSLNVSETDDPKISRMTIIVTGDEYIKSQIVKQLEKLHDVIRVELMPEEGIIAREHLLVKIRVTGETRAEIIEAVNIFRGKVVDFSKDTMILEATGESRKLDALIEFANQFGIIEMCRAGALAIKRGQTYLGE